MATLTASRVFQMTLFFILVYMLGYYMLVKLRLKVMLLVAIALVLSVSVVAIVLLTLLSINNPIIIGKLKAICRDVWKTHGINLQVHQVHIGQFILDVDWKHVVNMSLGKGISVRIKDVFFLVGSDPRSAKEFKANQVRSIRQEAPISVLAEKFLDLRNTQAGTLLRQVASFLLSLFSLAELVGYTQRIISLVLVTTSSALLFLWDAVWGVLVELVCAVVEKVLSAAVDVINEAVLKAVRTGSSSEAQAMALVARGRLQALAIDHVCHVLHNLRVDMENVHVRFEDHMIDAKTDMGHLSAGVTWKRLSLSLSAKTYQPSSVVLKPSIDGLSLYGGHSQLLCHLEKNAMIDQLRQGIATTECTDYISYYLLRHTRFQLDVTLTTKTPLGSADNAITGVDVRLTEDILNFVFSPQELLGVVDAVQHVRNQICGRSRASRTVSVPSPWCLPLIKSRLRQRWYWSDIQEHRQTFNELVACYLSLRNNQAIISAEKERMKKDLERIEEIEDRLDLFNIVLAKEMADIRYKRPESLFISRLTLDERVKIWSALERNSHLLTMSTNFTAQKYGVNLSLGKVTTNVHFSQPNEYLCTTYEEFETSLLYSNKSDEDDDHDRLSINGSFQALTVELAQDLDEDSVRYPILETVSNRQVKVLFFSCLARYRKTTQLIHTEINASNVADVIVTLSPRTISMLQTIYGIYQEQKSRPRPPIQCNYSDFWDQSRATTSGRFSLLYGLLRQLSESRGEYQTMKKITVMDVNVESNLVTMIVQDKSDQNLLRLDMERTSLAARNSESKMKLETDYRLSYFEGLREWSILTNGDPEHLMTEEAVPVTVLYRRVVPYGAKQIKIDLPQEHEVTLTPHSLGAINSTVVMLLDQFSMLEEEDPLASLPPLKELPNIKAVIARPLFPILNRAPFDLQCSPASGQMWNTIQSGECFWFQPQSRKEMIVFRTVDNFAETVPIAFQEEDNPKPVTLRLSHQYGGLRIDFITTQSSLIIVCDQLDAENVPLLVVNYLDDEIEVRERDSVGRFVADSKRCYERKGYLLAHNWRYFTWLQPNQIEKLTLFNREIQLTENVMANPFGHYDFSSQDPTDKRILYWVTFLYGSQSVLLVTTQRYLAEHLHKVKNVEPVALSFQLQVHRIFLLLVDNQQEILYMGITSSDPTKMAVSYQPAVTLIYDDAPHYNRVDFTIYHLQVDNQLKSSHPTIFMTDSLVPRIFSTYVHQRPLLQFSYIRVHSNRTGGFCYYQYTDLFIGNFTLNMEFGFILVLDEFFGLKLFQSFFQTTEKSEPAPVDADGLDQEEKPSFRLYFGILNICIPQVTCSYSSNNPVLMQMTPLSRFLTAFTEFKDVVLCCNDFHLEDVYLSKDQFYMKLFTHFVREGSKPFHKIAVGQDLSGNMGQLISDIGCGLDDLTVEHDAKRAFSCLIGGVIGHGANIARAMGKALEDLSSNPEPVEQSGSDAAAQGGGATGTGSRLVKKIKIDKKKHKHFDNVFTGFDQSELSQSKPVLKMFGSQANKKSMNIIGKTAMKMSLYANKCLAATKSAVDGHSRDPVITRMRKPYQPRSRTNRSDPSLEPDLNQ